MATAWGVWNQFYLLNHTRRDVHTIDISGALSVVPGSQLAPHQHMGVQYIHQTVNNGTAQPAGTLTVAQIATDLTAIETLTKDWAAGSYRAVKDDHRWQRIYRRRARNVNFLDATGHIGQRNYPATYPCHYCGIILPESLIQVDHRQPKATPWLAVLKCLRMIGNNYTAADGKGTKAGQIANLVGLGYNPTQAAVNAANLNRSAPDKRGMTLGFVEYPPADNTGVLHAGKNARYTLTDDGRTLLSCGMSIHGIAGFRDMCVNNLMNLVPACAQCNGNSDMGKGSMTYARTL